jgi:hypothetical protein
MALIRDFSTGGWDVVVCDMRVLSPLIELAGAESFSRADDCLLEGQSAMPARRDQPEKSS